MIKLLHFADAHIDIANYGTHDPVTGLPVRVMDFLKSLDTIVDTAIAEKVDLVIFAGDTYKDRSPAPTFQREWGKRIIKLSHASIPTILVTGNHDISPSQRKAHAMQEFRTLEVPFVHVVDTPCLLGPEQLDGLPVQIIAIPWLSKASVRAYLASNDDADVGDISTFIEDRLTAMIADFISQLNPDLPVILTAHATINGAKFGNEQTMKIGRDVALSPALVSNPRFDYVALGHIHRYQDMNAGGYPPVVYPGSIERVNFGEAGEDKGFVLAEVVKGATTYTWRKLNTRPYIDRAIMLDDAIGVNEKLLAALPSAEEMRDAVVRLVIQYPAEVEELIDEAALREKAALAFEFNLLKRPERKNRIRLPDGVETSSLTPLDLLDLYWKELHIEPKDKEALKALADQVMQDVNNAL